MERATREVWAKRVERGQDSGLTAKEFAAELDVSPNSLTFWKWKLPQPARAPRRRRIRAGAQASDTVASFLQLVPTPSPQETAAQIEVVLASGAVIRVLQNFDEPTLLRVVRALGAG
jgi:hypothetical protein